MNNNEKIFNEEPLNNSALDYESNNEEVKEEQNSTIETQSEEIVTPSQPDADEQPIIQPVEVKPKKKKPIIPIIIILVVLALVGSGIAFYLHLNSTKTIVTTMVNNLYDKFEANVEEIKNFDVTKESILLDANISFDTNIEDIKNLKNVKFNLNYGMDFKNKKIETGLSINEDNKKLFETLGYILDDNIYVLFKDEYPDLINIGKTNISELFTKSDVSIEDIEYIMKEYKNIFIKSLNMDDFEKTSDTITLNGSKVNVTKLTYKLDKDKQVLFTKNMSANASESKEFVDKLAKISGTTSDQIKNTLSDTSSLDNYESYVEPFTINIYVKGLIPELVGIDLSNENADIMQIRMNDKDTTIKTKINGEDALIAIKEESDVLKINLQTKINERDLNIDIDATKNKKDNKNYEGMVKLSAMYNKQNFEIDVDYKMKLGANISDIDVSKAKTINSISQSELNNIQEKIYTKLYNSKFYKMIMSLFQSN